MRLHTCLHLLCTVVDAGVTGGAIDTHKARLDFDLPEPTLDKAKIAVELNRLIKEDHAVEARWITDEQLAAPPELGRTMPVRPPTGKGQVRLMEVIEVDLRACGGTHVASAPPRSARSGCLSSRRKVAITAESASALWNKGRTELTERDKPVILSRYDVTRADIVRKMGNSNEEGRHEPNCLTKANGEKPPPSSVALMLMS